MNRLRSPLMNTLRSPLMAFALAATCVASAGHAAPATHSMSKTTARGVVLPFIEDDYTRALAEARARKLPLFVESWAPW